MLGIRTGNYAITEEIGEGGMGKVYVAEHALMGKRAAVKVLLPELSQNEELVNRFFNEARAATKVSHAGIVDIYDFGYLEDGSAYIVMELLEGEPLSALLSREAPLAPDRTARLGSQIADALAAAHEAGIIHRDLKPDNVFVVRDAAVAGGERAKLLDFGIAKLGGDNTTSLKTRTGALMGTPTYMSPEQCRGSAELDWRSDIYSAACIVFEMVSGRPPFVEHGLGDMLAAHMMKEPPSLADAAPSVPPELAAVVNRMLAKEPASRPQSMREVVHELAPIAGTTIPPGPGRAPTVPPERVVSGTEPTTLGGAAGVREGGEPGSRRLLIAGLGVAGALAAAAVVSFVVLRGFQPAEPASAGEAASDGPADAAVEEAAVEPADAAAQRVEAPADAAPAVPKMVTFQLDTRPSQAAVFDAETGERLGTTPIERELERGEGELSLVVKKRGFRDREVSIPLDEHAEMTVDLQRIRRTTGRTRSRGSDSSPKRGWGDILD